MLVCLFIALYYLETFYIETPFWKVHCDWVVMIAIASVVPWAADRIFQAQSSSKWPLVTFPNLSTLRVVWSSIILCSWLLTPKNEDQKVSFISYHDERQEDLIG